jgi:hypothetical protein
MVLTKVVPMPDTGFANVLKLHVFKIKVEQIDLKAFNSVETNCKESIWITKLPKLHTSLQ